MPGVPQDANGDINRSAGNDRGHSVRDRRETDGPRYGQMPPARSTKTSTTAIKRKATDDPPSGFTTPKPAARKSKAMAPHKQQTQDRQEPKKRRRALAMHKYIWTPDIEAELEEQERDIMSKKEVENVRTEDGVGGQVGTEDKTKATAGEKKVTDGDGTIMHQHASSVFRPSIFNKRKPLPSAKASDALPNVFDEDSSDDQDAQHDMHVAKKRKTVAPSADFERGAVKDADAGANDEGVRSKISGSST